MNSVDQYGSLDFLNDKFSYCKELETKFTKINSDLINDKNKISVLNDRGIDLLEQNYCSFLSVTSRCERDIVTFRNYKKKNMLESDGPSLELDLLIISVECLFHEYFEAKEKACSRYNNYWASGLHGWVPKFDTTLDNFFKSVSETVKGLVHSSPEESIPTSKAIENLKNIGNQLARVNQSLYALRKRLSAALAGISSCGLSRKPERIESLEFNLQRLLQTIEGIQESASLCQLDSSRDCSMIFPLPYLPGSIVDNDPNAALLKESQQLMDFCTKHRDNSSTILLAVNMLKQRFNKLYPIRNKLNQELQKKLKILITSYKEFNKSVPELSIFPRVIVFNNSLMQGPVELESGIDIVNLFDAYDQCHVAFFDIRNSASRAQTAIRKIMHANVHGSVEEI